MRTRATSCVLSATCLCIASLSVGSCRPSHDVPPSPTEGAVERPDAAETLEIEGVVLDARGLPVSGITVVASPAGTQRFGDEPRRRTARSGEDGRFRIQGLAAGRWRLASPPAIATDLPSIEEKEVDAGATGVSVLLIDGYTR